MNEPESQTPSSQPSGENPPGSLPEPSFHTLAAGEEAISQHAADTGKAEPKRGRPIIHGKYAGRKRNRVSVGKVANGSAPLLLEEALPIAPEIGTEALEPVFDEAVNREYAGLIIGFAVQVKAAISRRQILRKTHNAELADFVASKRTISEGPRKALETGLVQCAKKYNVDLGKSPEGMLAGGFLLWIAEDSANTRTLIDEYFKLRPQEKPVEPRP